jgi:hypothetical protein
MPTATNSITMPAGPPAPSRRSLFGAGAALIAGGALSDPAFVKPKPLPWRNGPRPPDGADAELIRLCHAFAEAEFGNWYRYVVAPVETADDDDTPPDWDTYHLIVATPATTPAGWHAKALAFAAWDREAYDDVEIERTPMSTFLASLLRDMGMPARNAIIARCAEAYGPLPSQYAADGVWIGYSAEEKARIDLENSERIRAREAEEAAKREAAEEPMTRERAEEMLASRSRLREAAEEIYQEAVDRLAAFEVAA